MKTKLMMFLLNIFLIVGGVSNLSAQVTIGESQQPLDISVLELISQQSPAPSGLRLPQMSATDVDILTSNINQLPSADKLRANGLIIFNTTTSCVMLWNGREFKSLCGDVGPAEMTFDCSGLQIHPNNGTLLYTPENYTQGTPLDGSTSYISVPVTVTKAGTYTVTATTGNGYSYLAEGTMLDVGSYTLKLAGSGTPINGNDNPQHYDKVTMSFNGEELTLDCAPENLPLIPVAPAVGKAKFDFNCTSSTVNGIYIINSDLNSTHTITVQVTVDTPGYYAFSAEAAGMKFSRNGEWTSTGPQTVTLLSSGKPTEAGIVPITINGDASGGTVTCEKTITVSYRAMKVLGFGGGTYQPGTGLTTQGVREILTSSANFGLTGTVPTQGINIVNGNYGRIAGYINSQNPDIIVIGYAYANTAEDNAALKDFVENKKGFVLVVQENISSSASLINAICGSSISVSGITGSGGGVVYQLQNDDNEILNGPFGDTRGKYVGEDASLSYGVSAIPAGATALTDKNFSFWYKNFVWVGDGGFLAGDRTNTNPNAWPMRTDSSGRPISKPYRMGTVDNATFYANIIAYAIKYVQENKK